MSTSDFSLDDVKDWLGCNDDAGRRIWFDSFFCVRVANSIVKEMPSAFRGLANTVVAKRQPISDKDRAIGTTRLSILELRDMALGLVIETAYVMKHAERKKPFDFSEKKTGGFVAYVKKRVSMELRDILTGFLSTRSLDENPSGPGSTEDASSLLIDTLADPLQEDTADDLWMVECARQAIALLDAFDPALGKASALRDRLTLLRSLPLETGAIGVIAFLETDAAHMEFLDHAKKRLGEAFNQNNWNSYNRRLRLAWRRFLEDEGLPLNIAFEECRVWNRKTIN